MNGGDKRATPHSSLLDCLQIQPTVSIKMKGVSTGMSRAAQNKRKKQHKIGEHLESSTSSSAFISTSADSSIQSNKKHKSNQTAKSAGQKLSALTAHQSSPVPDIDFATVSCLDILDMKEVVDVTSFERSSLIIAKFMHPTSKFDFYSSFWQKAPLHVSRNSKSYFKKIFTKKSLTTICANQLLFETTDIQFSNGKRAEADEDDDEDDKSIEPREVSNAAIWDGFAKGFSVSLLAPQRFDDTVWRLLSALEHEYGSMVGSTATLVPPSCTANELQYDCGDSFVLQLEGCSSWSIYEPTKGRDLPRTSDSNPTKVTVGGERTADEDDLYSGMNSSGNGPTKKKSKSADDIVPKLDIVMAAGDCLYIPRGWAYVQSNPSSSDASLSLKIFTNQGCEGGNTVADLLQILLPQALAEAAESTLQLRQSLPCDYRSFLGVAASEDESQAVRRQDFQDRVKRLLTAMVDTAVDALDPAADQVRIQLKGSVLD